MSVTKVSIQPLWVCTHSYPMTYTKEQPWSLEKLKSTEARV